MQLLICAVKDRAVESFQNLHTVLAEGQAMRQFMDAIADQQSGAMHKHPDDFDLYVLGVLDTESGQITPHQQPKKIADGKQMQNIGA